MGKVFGSSPAFVVDAMLGSLARKLRIFGYDTLYYKDGSDEGLIAEARTGGRVLITSDRALSELALRRGVTAILVRGNRDSQRLADLVRKASKNGIVLSGAGPRCALCNGALRRVRTEEAKPSLPQSVGNRHRLFYSCVDCGKVYWRGSHWTRLRTTQRLLVRKKRI